MELFIRVKDGKPFEHPLLLANLEQAIPGFDKNKPPEGYASFIRVEQPKIGVYEVYEGASYEWDGDVIKDTYHIKQMTPEEKLNKQNEAKKAWLEAKGWKSWIFNEETCSYEPPTPRPIDEKKYYWDEKELAWREVVNMGVTRV